MQTKLKFLSISIGLIYVLFGGLKFFPNLSPAESIGADTVQALTFHLVSHKFALMFLAFFEVAIGLLLLCNKCRKIAIFTALFHMIMTFSPFVIFPEIAFNPEVFSLSLLGQYIMKNIIIICALLVLYPTEESQVGVHAF